MRDYYVMETHSTGDEFIILKTDDPGEAFQAARDLWEGSSPYEKKHNTIEVRRYLYDIEDENCTCFDFDTYDDWTLYYEVCAYHEEWGEYGAIEYLDKGSFDFYEARAMALDIPEGFLEVKDYTNGQIIEALDRESLEYGEEF